MRFPKFKLSSFGFSTFEKWAILFLVVILLIGTTIRILRKQKLTSQFRLDISTQVDSTDKNPASDKRMLSHSNPLDINQATAQQLRDLPGIGPVKADQIIALREKLGRIDRAEDLTRIKGIGPKTVAKLKPLIYITSTEDDTFEGADSLNTIQIKPHEVGGNN